ncbi:ras-related protein Rab-15-like isoform 2-T2 [Spinachia spinachia]
MAKHYDVLFRLLVLGDSGVGKTCMLRGFTEGHFDSSHISTIGVDFKMRTLELDGTRVRVQIWDTAGQERYQTITKQYYRRAQGVIFVYDITSESSFQHLVKWAGDVDEYAPDEVQKILVGNKSDEEPSRKLAETYGMEFFETSASTGDNIREAFTRVTQLVLRARGRGVDDLLGSLDGGLGGGALEEEEGTGDPRKPCAC